MRYAIKIIVCCLIIFCMSGCTKQEGNVKYLNKSNVVNNVIKEQMDNAKSKKNGNRSKNTNIEIKLNKETSSKTKGVEEKKKRKKQNRKSIDYDLTTMGSDMVFAIVYQMMVNPKEYVGKTVRIDGSYYSIYDETTGKKSHFCIIQDATACCAQGMEFILDDSHNKKSNKYPEEEAEVVIEGTFETYHEDTDNNLYCRLKNAVLEVKKK